MSGDPKWAGAGSSARALGGGAAAILVVLGLLAGLLGEKRSEGKEPEMSEPELPRPCGGWHRGAGMEDPLDLGAVRRAYATLREAVARSLDRRTDVPPPDADRAFDAGLPACAALASRTLSVPGHAGDRLRGERYYFVSAPDPARLRLPPDVEADTGARILVVYARTLRDLPVIARVLGRPVGLASADLARALGVRCANTLVRISEDGNAATVHEYR